MSRSSARQHLGTGALGARRETCVFINCPFDSQYQPIFDSIIFSVLCCGFLPRCAIESGTAAQPRIERILAAMRGSKYSIHDLSRCQGEGDMNLARFNMPLELGMAMSQRFASKGRKDGHDWLALVPKGHVYKRFLSDLAGYDPIEYGGDPSTVVPAVMSWLATRRDAVRTPTPDEVLTVLPTFVEARKHLTNMWHEQVPWTDLLLSGIEVARECHLVPR